MDSGKLEQIVGKNKSATDQQYPLFHDKASGLPVTYKNPYLYQKFENIPYNPPTDNNSILGKRTLSTESNDSSNAYPTAVSDYNQEDAEELEMLESFAKEFKQKRIKMNFTQGDVGAAMGKLYGNDFSQTTISRFEALNLSCKNMVKLKPLLERWLIDANAAVFKLQKGEPLILAPQIPIDPNLPPMKKRKKRTSIDPKQKDQLDVIFRQNPRPSSELLTSIAEKCSMEKEVVRVWFCNRRQKAKRMNLTGVEEVLENQQTPPISPLPCTSTSSQNLQESKKSPFVSTQGNYQIQDQVPAISSHSNQVNPPFLFDPLLMSQQRSNVTSQQTSEIMTSRNIMTSQLNAINVTSALKYISALNYHHGNQNGGELRHNGLPGNQPVRGEQLGNFPFVLQRPERS